MYSSQAPIWENKFVLHFDVGKTCSAWNSSKN